LGGPTLTVPGPFLGISKPNATGLLRPPIGRTADPATGRVSFEVKQEWSGLTASSAWDVKGEVLEMLPEDFPLERTHRYISGVQASAVAARISESLRSHSIEVEFDCQKAKAKCKTQDYVSFRIRLYAGGENADPVIVEVQRRCGPVSSFMVSCRAILDAAEGKVGHHASTPNKKIPAVAKSVRQMKCLQSVLAKQEVLVDDCIADLGRIASLLKSDRFDQNVLAMENLCCLTDPIRSSGAAALRVSKCVILGDEQSEIREEVRALTERDVFDRDEVSRHHSHQLRQLAHVTFANTLSMCSKSGHLATAIKDQKWFHEFLIPTLLDELKLAKVSPCSASAASRSLFSVMTSSESALRQILEQDVMETLKMANEFGRARHALLFNETARLLKLCQ
jgi:hypothetical protein